VHVAQLNIARLLAPIESPKLSGFVRRLDEVNAVADRAPGFVWRLQSESGNATDIRPWGDDVIVNMSVWESVEALRAYVYGPEHVAVLRRRRDWFSVLGHPHVVVWYVPVGHLPDLDEARQRLDLLERDGPGPEAFTLRVPFPVPA
jgi:heme-degrading monooxygenase HmoA